VNPRSWEIQRRELPDGFEVSLPPVAAGLQMIPDLSPGVLFGDEAEGAILDLDQLRGLCNFVRADVLPRLVGFFT
jgi:hypothetical protein